MKTKVKVTSFVNLQNYKQNDEGYIDGYVQIDDKTHAIVVIGDHIAVIPLMYLTVIQ